MPEKFSQIKQAIDQADHILLSAHVGIDGDALGSLIAFSNILKQQNKKFSIILEKKIPKDFQFLNGLKNTILIDDFLPATLPEYDLLILLDMPSESRSPLANILTPTNQPRTILIDHHPVSNNNAWLNVSDHKKSSTCEIIFEFLDYIDEAINKHTATALLCGIATDTSFFNNPATNPTCMKTASRLIGLGGNYQKIIRNLLQNKKVNYLKFLGNIFDRVVYNEKYNFVSIVITKKDIDRFKLEDGDIKSVANFLQQNISSADKFLVLREEGDGILRGNLRSARSNIRDLAVFLGGGGHMRASGFQIEGELEEVSKGKYKIRI